MNSEAMPLSGNNSREHFFNVEKPSTVKLWKAGNKCFSNDTTRWLESQAPGLISPFLLWGSEPIHRFLCWTARTSEVLLPVQALLTSNHPMKTPVFWVQPRPAVASETFKTSRWFLLAVKGELHFDDGKLVPEGTAIIWPQGSQWSITCHPEQCILPLVLVEKYEESANCTLEELYRTSHFIGKVGKNQKYESTKVKNKEKYRGELRAGLRIMMDEEASMAKTALLMTGRCLSEAAQWSDLPEIASAEKLTGDRYRNLISRLFQRTSASLPSNLRDCLVPGTAQQGEKQRDITAENLDTADDLAYSPQCSVAHVDDIVGTEGKIQFKPSHFFN